MEPTEKQISAAHDAWERTVTQWKMRRVNNYGLQHDTWILENNGSGRYEAGTNYADEIAAHRFDGEDAERTARFALRDKCIRSALTAALAAT